MKPIRVLIVVGSPLMRQVLGDLLGTQAGIEVVGFGRDGDDAVRLTRNLEPDVVALDSEIPGRSGVETLAGIMAVAPTPVIMVSAPTPQGVQATFDALDRGAVDFVCKPRSGSLPAMTAVRNELAAKIEAAAQATLCRKLRRGIMAAPPTRPSDRVLVIASGTGGHKALTCLFETLPAGLGIPVLVAHQMAAGFTSEFAHRLNRIGHLACEEAHEGHRLVAGRVLVAPGDRHMSVTPSGDIDIFDGPPPIGRPAADHLFRSAAEAFGSRTIAVLLTGAGQDGVEGAKAVRKHGGIVYGESESTCTVYGMCAAAKQAGAIDAEYPIHELGHAIVATLSKKLARAS